MKTTFTITNNNTKVTHQITLIKSVFRPETKMSTETFYKTVKWLRPRLSQSELPIIKDTSTIPSHVSIIIDNLITPPKLYGTLPIDYNN